MTNVFKQIKQIFINNKEYFIKCTLMSIIAALIIGLAIGLFLPVSAEASSVPTDLTGYTVTVPAVWSSTAGYGQYSFDFDYSSGGSSLSGTRFGIGYRFDYDTFEAIPTANAILLNGNYEVYSSSTFTLNISGGSDATNSSLIQWFVDNNATFTNNSVGVKPTIKKGTYRWKDSFETLPTDECSINFTIPDFTLDGYDVIVNGIWSKIGFTSDSILYYGGFYVNGETEGISYQALYTSENGWNTFNVVTNGVYPEGLGQTITVTADTEVDDTFATWFEANTEPVNPSAATIAAGTYFGVDVPSSGSFNVSFSFESNSTVFDTFYVGSDSISYRALSGNNLNVTAFDFASDLWTINYETITVPTDQTLPSDFVTWFNANYTTQITPDPEPTYTIEAGYYKARDSFTTSGWNVSNDSIRIRFYDDAVNALVYRVVDGISFILQNDMAEIYYGDYGVFTDGWNINGAKNIQVMQDIVVGSDFYTVFNNVYAPSSEGTNEFDSGYAAGYADGRDAGYDIGYRQGYQEGLSDGDTNIFVDIIGGTLAAVDSFTIFGGFSLLDLISTLLGGMALVWILKLLAGG